MESKTNKTLWKDPRTGEIYYKIPAGEFLKSGLHKKYLVKVIDEEGLVKIQKIENNIRKVITNKKKVQKSDK